MDWMRKDLRQSGAARNAFRGNRGALFNFTSPKYLFSDAAAVTEIVDATGIYWARDLSGNNNDISQATSGSRPTWSVNGYATFDGSADYLFRTDSIRWAENGEYTPNWSCMFQVNASPATSTYLLSIGSSASTNQIFSLGANSTTAATLSAFIRDDASGAAQAINSPIKTDVFNGAPNIVCITAEGTEAQAYYTVYLNGVRATRVTGAAMAGGTHTFNRSAIGCLLRTSAASFMAMNLYHIMLIDRILSHSEVVSIGQEWRREARV